MPLVVPGLTSTDANTSGGGSSSGGAVKKEDEWSGKLLGKKLGEKHDEKVCDHVHLGGEEKGE